ncbi:MAG: cupin domain-containing protein [Elusimicrobiota bacterium]
MKRNTARFGLRALIEPLSPERFYREHWPRRPLVSHGPLARFGGLSRIPELQDVELLCEATRGPVTVFGEKGRQTNLEDGAAAFPFYDDGETLYFRRLQRSIPALAELAASLARDFGVWPEDVAVEAFASRDGSGTAMHFDSEQNFNIQLRGTKTWRLAENRSVVDPMQSFVAGRPLPAELKSYSVRSYPKRMPKAARTVRMREGSALYLPRGYWHDTVVQGDSLAVCFAVKPQVWAGVLLDVLRRRLIQDPGWRQGVFGLAGDARRRAALERCLARLLPPFAEAADLSEGKLEALPSRKTP